MTSGVNLQDSVLSPVETMSNQQLSRDTGGNVPFERSG